ncbi:MAG: Hpt domain-containing protein [Phycisphaerae bacterium]|nr:Hpt domain-containing protein [Phycisphaerae bacterium]
MYLDQTDDQLTQITAAIESGTAAEVARLAHGCAGASGTSGVSSMVSLFRDLETAGENNRMEETVDLLKKAKQQFEKIRELLKNAPSE